MEEYINDRTAPIDRFAPFLAKVFRRVMKPPELVSETPEIKQYPHVLFGDELVDVTETTAGRGSDAALLEQSVIEQPDLVAAIVTVPHPRRDAHSLHWVVQHLGGGLQTHVVLEQNTRHPDGHIVTGEMMYMESGTPLAHLFRADPERGLQSGRLNTDAQVRLLALPSNDIQLDTSALYPDKNPARTDCAVDVARIHSCIGAHRTQH